MKKRVITGIVAAIPLLALAVIGGIPFTILASVLAVIVTSELLRMRNIAYLSLPGVIAFLLTLLIVTPEKWLYQFANSPLAKVDGFLLALFILLAFTVFSKNRFSFDEIAFVLISALYAGFGFYFFNMTRMMPAGLPILFFVLLTIWSTDSGAYFIGKQIGKRKLWPAISPKKTIAGAVGGMLSAVAISLLFQLIYPLFHWLLAIFIAVVISIFAQIGDLVGSALKRHYDVKDSGGLLPGHGGLLDRCDSWIFVFPVLHVLQLLG